MEQIEAVLFDLDGTLIDSEHFYYSNWQPILAEHFDLTITFEDWLALFAGHTLARNVHFLKKNWGIETSEAFMWKETRAAYARADMRTISLMPFAREILQNLHAAGKRIGLVTSSYQTTVDTVLGHHGLLGFFEFFVTREKVVQAKPNAEPYLMATKLMGLAPVNLLAVEDTATGLRAAQDAGLRCVAVSRQAVERARLTSADYMMENLFEVNEMLL
ncbi:HAD family hydrolase [Sphingobacterium griseoflavum]|uniref:Haloacid dehalogenase n=1 Tax=Sphingobacterium griseoflavum TaxID=1474952 RepID=A0ABQ3HYT2_9SPHI|nr:HAD family phosphatase [Sphingobacterium griseoflavum]GHE41222.1 haloacid dehalogenase [Sphingobacterium griseoflavum]